MEQNIAANYSLKSADIRRKVDELLELTHLKGFEKSYPRALSGGMSQRVSIARALLREPQVLLLDEPFGALDAFTRTHMQEAILEIWENKKTTMVLVTHDIDEAVFVANKIVIMGAKPGVIRDVIPNHLPYPRKKSKRSFSKFPPEGIEGIREMGKLCFGRRSRNLNNGGKRNETKQMDCTLAIFTCHGFSRRLRNQNE